VWPCEATSGGLVHGQEDEMKAALFFARLCVPLRGLITGNNPSQTELYFLVAEHSAGRMWAGGILYITLWYVPFCYVLSYKDHLRMMLQHGLCFGSFCCVRFAFLFLLT
jgi:hypothetical protein